MMGDMNEVDLFKINPEQILNKELEFSEISKIEAEYSEEDDSIEVVEENKEFVPVSNIEEHDQDQEINISSVAENQSTEVFPSSYKQTYNFEIEKH